MECTLYHVHMQMQRGCLACFGWQLQPAQRCSERGSIKSPVGAAMELILQRHHRGQLQPHVHHLGAGKVPRGGMCLLLVTMLCFWQQESLRCLTSDSQPAGVSLLHNPAYILQPSAGLAMIWCARQTPAAAPARHTSDTASTNKAFLRPKPTLPGTLLMMVRQFMGV